MCAKYLESLRKHYVQEVVKAMVFEVLKRGKLAFNRCYALLSLLALSEKHPEREDGFTLEEVFEQAKSEGYKQDQPGIRAGLSALYDCGIGIMRGGTYSLHPKFEIEVKKFASEIKKAIP